MLKEISIEIIRKCPNNCLHCSSFSNKNCSEIIPYELFKKVVSGAKNLGLKTVCFSGGEPFLQAEGLADVAQACRKMGLSVMVFSGYQLEELDDARFKGASQLLKVTDVLVDGEYQQALIENVRNWVGSTNQRFHYFTDFYDVSIETRSLTVTNEWRIDAQGNILGNGLPFILKANN